MLTNLPASVKFACWSPNIIEFSPHYFVERQASPGPAVVGFKFLSNSDSLLSFGLSLVVLIDRGAVPGQEGGKVRPGGQKIKNIPGTFRPALPGLLGRAGALDWSDGQPGYRRQLDVEIYQELPEITLKYLKKQKCSQTCSNLKKFSVNRALSQMEMKMSLRWIMLMIFFKNKH